MQIDLHRVKIGMANIIKVVYVYHTRHDHTDHISLTIGDVVRLHLERSELVTLANELQHIVETWDHHRELPGYERPNP